MMRERVESIDTLRGMGAIFIIVFHIFFLANLKLPDGLVKTLATMGGAAVPLFFAISAFSMAYSYDRRLFETSEIQRYFIRRYFRIAPLFYFMLIINMLVGWIFANTKYKLLDIFLSLTFLFPFIPGKHPSLVMAGWAVGIEWIFYALFPILILLSSTLSRSFILLIISLVISIWIDDLGTIFPGVPDAYFYMNFANHLVFFVSGFVVYRAFPYLRKMEKYNFFYRNIMPIFLFFMGWLFLFFYFYYKFNFAFDIIMVSVWCLWLCGAVIGFPNLISNRFIKHIGTVSYSTYLTHPIVIVLFIKANIYTVFYDHVNSNTISFLFCCIFTILIVVAISTLTYRYIEEPGIKLGKNI
jgi:peptidoglycan/LPS O-acetylase OafA/YrhL